MSKILAKALAFGGIMLIVVIGTLVGGFMPAAALPLTIVAVLVGAFSGALAVGNVAGSGYATTGALAFAAVAASAFAFAGAVSIAFAVVGGLAAAILFTVAAIFLTNDVIDDYAWYGA